MPSKIWTFALEDGPHIVELEYSYWSPREKFRVDGELLSDEMRWTIKSGYIFWIGPHECRASITATSHHAELLVDGQPMEMLSSQILLRPASANSTPPDMLLRPASGTTETAPEELLRPGMPDESA